MDADRPRDAEALVKEFFLLDDLRQLTQDAGELLACPLLLLDDTFHIVSHFCPLGFSDPLFDAAVAAGEITYEAGALISKSAALSVGNADFIKPDDSPYRRRFAPLFCTGVRLGYLICVDTDEHLEAIPSESFRTVETVLAKQLFIEAARKDKPFETAEDILMHLLDGGFSSASYFRLQAAGTYLSDFHPSAFALVDLAFYQSQYLGKRHLKEEIRTRFPDSHPFLYRGDVFLFLHDEEYATIFSELAEEFGLKVILSEPIRDLFDLPALYLTAHDAMTLIVENGFRGGRVFSAGALRTPLLLKALASRSDLISPELRALAEHDKKKETQYCETLYYYLIFHRSLKKTCDALFTHRNTVLYRMDKIRDDFCLPFDDPSKHAELLIGVASLLFRRLGASFFLQKLPGDEDAPASRSL